MDWTVKLWSARFKNIPLISHKYPANIPHTSREIPKYCLVVVHPFKDSTWSLSSSSSASLDISLSDRIFFGQALLRERKEIYSFEASGDYVMDVAWSPVRRKKCPMCWVVYNMEKSICWNIQLFPRHQVVIPTLLGHFIFWWHLDCYYLLRCTLHYLQAWRLAAQLNCGT